MAVCMIWFVAMYTKRSSKRILITFTIVFFLIVIAAISQPYGVQFDMINSLKRSTLPWGESYSNAEGTVSLIYKMGLLTLVMALVYVIYALASLVRTNPNRSNISMLIAACLFAMSYVEGALVRTGLIDFLPMGPFGILGFILAMSLVLNQEYSDERKAAALAIEQDRKRLETILKTSSDDICIIDSNGLLVEANEAFLDNRGLDESVIGHLHASAWNAQFDQVTLMQRIQAMLNTEDKVTFETQHSRLDGSIFEVEISANSFEFNGARYLFNATRDITERKHNQLEMERRVVARTAELATARAEAESANAVKTRFMTNVSHEMRTPLSVILGFAEIGKLKANKQTIETFSEYFEKILVSGKRLNMLIESLFSLAQDEWDQQAGIPERELQEVRPEILVIQCISFMQRTAKIKQQEIVFENTSTIPIIHADESKLRQVLEHLLHNALRYSGDQTMVTVKITDKPITSGLPTDIIIKVIDEGCGVPEKEMKAIFEPFYESSRTATGSGGTGLGLALCKSIVERHRGKIAVLNRAEGGAIFEITLPKI
jgi:PAS domain S-box-containing protein